MVCFCLIVAARYRLRSDFANSTRDPRVILVAISLPPSDQWLNGAMGPRSVAFQMRQHPKSGNNSAEAMRTERHLVFSEKEKSERKPLVIRVFAPRPVDP